MPETLAAPRTGAFSAMPAIAEGVALYKQGMRRLASGVTVVTTTHEGGRFGLVSTAINSISTEPPILLVSVNQAGSAHDPIRASKAFCVNVLREDDTELAGRFSSSKLRETRFLDRDWHALQTGAPALAGCLASFDCEVLREVEIATHTLFFGQVVETRLWTDEIDPLLYWNGSYRATPPGAR
jgi:flavin reductase